jgi:tetratricopeptide (TPR) repeat protein
MDRRFISVFAAVAVVFGVNSARAQQACIEEKSKQALNACANVQGPKEFDVTKHGKAPQVNFHSAPPPVDLKKKEQDKKAGRPDLELSSASRDDRAKRLQARARALLVTEINQLENLFNATGQNAPDRVQLLRRLAEDYVELESAAFKEKTQAEIDRDNLKKNPATQQQASQKAQQALDGDRIMKAARQKAINSYTMLKNQYPNYSQLDEVLYYLAYEYEQAQDYNNARKVYYELIQKIPNSKYIPNAYLAFGELFFNEAQGDPSKWDTARDAYKEVIKYPPPNNKVYGYAWYKLAYVFWNKGEFEQALNAFKKTIDYGVQFSQLPNAAKLAESARRDLVPVYALKGDPAGAYNFFKGLSGDPPGSNDHTFKMMDDLGNNYLDTGHYPEGIALYKDLIVRDRGSGKHCVYQSHITEATMAMKSGNKDVIKNELENQRKVYSEFRNSGATAEQKQECANRTAGLLSETAMAWHLEAVGSQGQRGTGDPKTMALAAEVYKKVVDSWTAQEFATFQFPRIVKEDWPTIYKIKYAMADLLYFQKDWAKCGPAFDSVVAENPNAPEAPEAAYASVLCYQNIYDETHKGDAAKKGSGNLPGQKLSKAEQKAAEDEKLKPKELTENQKGMLQAFNRYICYIKPAANDATGQEQLVEVKYARARTYFEAQHWEEAAIGFREIAMNHSDRDVGIYAAQLYLESINVLGSHTNPPRSSCYDDMQTDVPKFIELYCSGEKASKNAEQCTTLNKIQVDLLRLKAEAVQKEANAKLGSSEGLALQEKAGTSYFDMFRKYCQEPVNAGQQPQAERCDEIVYNAAKAFQAARLLAKAIRARIALLDFDSRTKGNSPLAKKAIYEIGANYQAIAVYDQAADWYEKYAKADKTADKADSALADAVVLRIGLGQEKEAIDDAQLFTRNYGATKPAQTASIAFAIGAHYAEKEDWEKAKSALSGYMGVIDKAAPDIQAQAHATLARAYLKGKNGEAQARGEYAKVRGLWQNPGDAVARIKAAYPGEDEGTIQRRVGKALNAVGEAYFFNAEEMKAQKVDTIKFPAYNGPGTKDDVLKHINTKVKDWLEKKGPAIEAAAAEYKKIVDLQPDAPPKWVIAAGSRVGLMWGQFVDDFRAAPIPKAWKSDAELRGVYYDALDAKSEPIKVQKAKPALVTCLTYSVKFQYFDEYSRSCEVWLAKNYKAEYHVVDELRGAPTLSNSVIDEKSPPLLGDGQFWHPQAQVDKAEAAAQKAEAEKEDKDTKKPAAAPAGGGAKPKGPPPGAKMGTLPGQKKK